ncbi:hypothetical protein [Haloarchaeobius sp. DFWS5]|uniref:hypothetical protein n=1 Tax=Haloarchaeobius sp. DFWS5 TaxID=3446114 RepID=UPI003EB9F676
MNVIVENGADSTQVFEVVLVPISDNVTIHHPEGPTRSRVNHTVSEGFSNVNSGPYRNFEDVLFPESARRHGNYTLTPGETVRRNVTEFSSGLAIVVVVHQEDGGIIAFASGTCTDSVFHALNVSSYPNPDNGVSIVQTCG